jgi:hypothetical protein
MVSKHLRRMLCAFEVVAELLKALYNSEQFTIISLIGTFGRIQLSRPESNQIPTYTLLACV